MNSPKLFVYISRMSLLFKNFIFTIMNHDSPEVDKGKHAKV